MKKLILGFILVVIAILFAWEYNPFAKQENYAIKIGDIGLTAAEFNQAYEASRFRTHAEDKKSFLDTYISRKLILKQAEELGLDKNPQFLADLQLFWEQSLLKLMMRRKIKEITTNLEVDEQEVINYYKKHRSQYEDKSIKDVYADIKWLIWQQKQSQAIDNWINSLKNNANIKIDYRKLGIER
jgi:hypothetical protein